MTFSWNYIQNIGLSMHTVHDTHFRQNGIDQDSQFSQFILIFTWFRLASDVSIVEMPTDIVQSIKYLTLPLASEICNFFWQIPREIYHEKESQIEHIHHTYTQTFHLLFA